MIVQFREWLNSKTGKQRSTETKTRGLEKLTAAVKDLSAVSHALAIETRHCPFARFVHHQTQRSR